MPMSLDAWRIASTALPSETPGAVSKPSVVAGYCATWVICSGEGRSVMVATPTAVWVFRSRS